MRRAPPGGREHGVAALWLVGMGGRGEAPLRAAGGGLGGAGWGRVGGGGGGGAPRGAGGGGGGAGGGGRGARGQGPVGGRPRRGAASPGPRSHAGRPQARCRARRRGVVVHRTRSMS